MSIFSAIGGFISGIFKPAADLIDELHVSDEERDTLRNELAKIQTAALTKMTELEQSRLDAISKVQVAEANSKFWLTATWRPICSILCFIIITLGAFELIKQPAKEFYELAQIFLGSYAAGRSLEKIGSVVGVLGKVGK